MKWHLQHKVHGAHPWAVQVEALRRSDGLSRYGHFLEQGLGKTAVDINEFIEYGDVDLNIVLAPNSFKADWPLALDEWGVGFIPSGMWPNDDLPFDWEGGLFAIAHESVRGSKRLRDGLLQLMKTRRCMLTFDESTGIKEPNAGISKYVTGELVKDAKYVRLLNGTPMVQNVMDYYPQLRALGEFNGVNQYQYRNRYAKMGGFMGRKVVGLNDNRTHELATIIERVAFRALKKDWRKDMPPQIQQPVHVEMTDKQRQHYQTMMEEFYSTINDDIVLAEMVMIQMDKLRQISSCLLMNEGRVHWLEEPKDNPKFKATVDLVNSCPGKAIVVHFYRESGEMLFDAFSKMKYQPARIKGRMKPEQIIEEKRRFNDDPDCRVLVGQIDQTSRGHTLIGQPGRNRCSTTIYYENSFSLYQRLQMNDRTHRGAQDEPCMLYDVVTSPMDQIVCDVLVKKKELADCVDDVVAEIRRMKHGHG